jgi:AcrR family transcriptional regulator
MGLRAEKKNKLRGQILLNAIRLFKERGFDEVTIDDIIGELEISQATFFNYFPSKDALLEQAAEETLGRYREMLENEVRRDAPTAEKITRLLEAMGQGLQGDKRFYRTLFTRSVLHFGNVKAERILSDLSAALMRQGQRRGEIRPEYDPHELADIFIGTYYAIIMRWLHGDGTQPLVERLHRGAAIFLSGVARSPRRMADRRPQRRRTGAQFLETP